ncbi:hypothetical protein [Streptomyces sp. S465]|uniref:hypothetical protein n=1 Tax=Streptomyces sp. S465 TaxID=2979468 RepID=UPI0022A88894|nr:hypothetical protein [Streptomyces sp. S465]WAP54097.1 hypothetical protein N6H00_03475 [Streptomyces sp. S465]
MVHGRRMNRPAVRGGPCAAAVLLLLAVTLLHAVLPLGAVRDSPTTGLARPAPGTTLPAAPGAPDAAVPGSVPAPALATSVPAGAPVLAPVVPDVEEERSASASAVFSARDGGGHPARHAGRLVHGASLGAHRSLSTSPGPLVLVVVRGRLAGHATGVGAFGAGGDVPAGRLSSRSVVLRC